MNEQDRINAQLSDMNPLKGVKKKVPAIYSADSAVVPQLLRTALEGSVAPCILYDADDAIIFVNDAARAIWPVAVKAMENGSSLYEASLKQIYHDLPDFPASEAEAMAKIAADGHRGMPSRDIEGPNNRKYRLTHTILDDGKVLGFGVDITSLHDRETELEAEKAQAIAAKTAGSAFLARMSHEIKTPLNAIVGMSDALLQEDISQETRETMEFILSAADGLNHVLGQTLDHAKIMADKIEVDLREDSPAEVLRSVCGMWAAQCKTKGLTLRTRIDPNVPETLYFDRYRYQQCLNNLLSNATKFTETGGVTVAMKLVPGAKPRLALVVKDTGIGMTDEAQSRIFQEYEQAETSTTRRFGGTGLGLNIVNSLITAMDGKIKVQSVPGEGTTFLMVIPAFDSLPQEAPVEAAAPAEPVAVAAAEPLAAEIAPQAEITAPPAIAETPFSGLNVLCVEDNSVNQVVVNKLIGKQVNSLTFAENGEIALEALAVQEFDVVLMDIHMPVMDGIETTLEIRKSNKAWANVIIIALTADPDYQQARICRNLGMNGSIAKPVTRSDIAYAFESAIANIGETFGSPAFLPMAASA